MNQQSADLFRLFLLHPMSGAVKKMESDHARAGAGAHPVDRAWLSDVIFCISLDLDVLPQIVRGDVGGIYGALFIRRDA